MQTAAMKWSLGGLIAIVAAGLGAAATFAAIDPTVIVSQKNRKFDPGYLDLKRGETIVIVNDDGDLLHHAYVESETFNFDSGDQKPGSRVSVAFTVPGDFKVLCGIHPKMKLAVHVE